MAEPILTRERRWSRLGRLAPLILAAAFLVQPFAPFPDIPFHLAAASVRHELPHDPAVASAYALDDSFGPNSLFHYAAAAIGPVHALRFGLAAYVLLFAVLVRAIARRFETSPAFPLIAFLLCMNFSVQFGFLEYVFSIPVLLAIILHLGAPAGTRPRRWAILLAVLVLLSFLAHALMACFALLLVVTYGLLGVTLRPRERGVAALLATLPTLGAIIAWRLAGAPEFTGAAVDAAPLGLRDTLGWLHHYYTWAEGWIGRRGWRLRTLLTGDHHALLGERAGELIGMFISVGILSLAAVQWRLGRRRSPEPAPPNRPSRRHADRTTAALLLVAGGTAILGPPGLPPYWFIFQRFGWVLFFAVALAALRLPSTGRPRHLLPVLAIANILFAGLWAEHLVSFREVPRDLRRLAPHTASRGPGAILLADQRYRGEPAALRHVGSLLTVFSEGVITQSQVYDMPFARIRRASGPAGDALLEGNAWPRGTPLPDHVQWALVQSPGTTTLPESFSITAAAGRWAVLVRD